MKNLNFVLTFYLPKFWGIDFKNHTHLFKILSIEDSERITKIFKFFWHSFFCHTTGLYISKPDWLF